MSPADIGGNMLTECTCTNGTGCEGGKDVAGVICRGLNAWGAFTDILGGDDGTFAGAEANDGLE